MKNIVQDILDIYNSRLYVRLGSDYSVTDLQKPPRIVALEERHRYKLEVKNIESILPALIGTATHEILQKYLRQCEQGDYMIERRMMSYIHGIRLSGRFDILDSGYNLTDIKVTKVWSYLNGGKDEWAEQQNIYKWMLAQEGIRVNSLNIMMVLLDWNNADTWQISNYPESRVQIIKLPMWSNKDIQELVEFKLIKLIDASKQLDNDLPLCTPKERWARGEKWKLFRLPTHKRAIKTFDSESKAKNYLKVCKRNDKDKFIKAVIKHETGMPWFRCENWCPVKDFCNQYKKKVEV